MENQLSYDSFDFFVIDSLNLQEEQLKLVLQEKNPDSQEPRFLII